MINDVLRRAIINEATSQVGGVTSDKAIGVVAGTGISRLLKILGRVNTLTMMKCCQRRSQKQRF